MRALAVATCLLAGACGRAEPPADPLAAVREAAARAPAAFADTPQSLAAELGEPFALLQQGAFAEATAAIERYAARPDAIAYQADFLAGLALHKAKRYAGAKPHFLGAVEAAPGYAPTWHFLGWCGFYTGDVALARLAFETHLALVPDEADSHFGLGVVALEEDRVDDAEGHLEAALALNEADPDELARTRDVAKCRARLGDVALRRGDVEGARTAYEAALSLWPAHYEVWAKLGRALARLGEEELSEQAFAMHDRVRDELRPREAPEPE